MVEDVQETLTSIGSKKRDADLLHGLGLACGLRPLGSGLVDAFSELRQRSMTMPTEPGYAYRAKVWAVAEDCGNVGLASLMLLGDITRAHYWLAWSGALWRDTLERTGGEYSRYALHAIGTIRIAGDKSTLRTCCALQLASDEGVPGRKGPGGTKSPAAQDHYWHFMNLTCQYYANGEAAGRDALALLLAQKPCTQWKHSTAWWLGMCELARASFGSDAEAVRAALAHLGPINQKMWSTIDSPNEAGLALMALAVASIAADRGLDLRPAPHPSCPTELFYMEPVKLEHWPWSELPNPDPELAQAILRGADGDIPRWRKKSKRAAKKKI